jgi:predicted nucleic acid-binding Zn ribbon protein
MEPVSSAKELEIETAAPEAPEAEAVPEAAPVVAPEEAPPEPAAAEEAPPAEEPVAAAVAAVEEKALCPACGADVLPGEAFCANCGASLAQGPVAPEPEPEVEPEPEAPPLCPACGTEIEPGDAFCSTCGFALKAVAPVAKPAEEVAAVVPPAPVTAGPRLVLADSGAEIPLPAGEEILVGREDPVSGVYPDIDLTPHGGEQAGVSRRHARLIVEGGSYFVEDLDSTNFTFVNKQKLAAKTRQPVGDGDEIRFGRIATVLRVS